MELENITNLKAVTNKEGELQLVKANLGSELHYTADVRKMFIEKWYAVFSSNTKHDEVLHSGVDLCIKESIYLEHGIEAVSLQTDHYTWVEIDFKGLQFKR